MKKIELLAPAKDKYSAIAAIRYGADAVYIGSVAYGARKNASNSISDIKEVVEYAHVFFAKVYVTLNTLLFDNEFKDVEKLIQDLYYIGVDALIIQDMGILNLNLPPIKLFASTQCHNSSLEKVKFLQKLGFDRVILARELSVAEISKITENTEIDIETFVHGALCVSYSGQCYLSLANGGRSANRGECAQPCRKKYSLLDENGKMLVKDRYLLSLKDFNASEYLEKLIDAGVTSFKIEGRLKNINYVKNVVAFYRQKIDEILSKKTFGKASTGHFVYDFEPDVYKSFNRGFTDYFLNGRTKNIFNFNSQKSLGEPIGRVKSINGNFFELERNIVLNKQDGFCFFDKNGELKGSKINTVKNNFMVPLQMCGLKKGDFIYRNYNFDFEKLLDNSAVQRKIIVDINIEFNKDILKFVCVDEDGVNAEILLENKFEPAKKSQYDTLKKQFSKLGESVFSLKNINITLNSEPFIPVKNLNEIRRNLLKKLYNARLNIYISEAKKNIRSKNIDTSFLNNDYSLNITNSLAGKFYNDMGEDFVEKGLDITKDFQGKNLMTTKHCLRFAFDSCSRTCKSNAKWTLIDEAGNKYNLFFDCKNCVMKITQ